MMARSAPIPVGSTSEFGTVLLPTRFETKTDSYMQLPFFRVPGWHPGPSRQQRDLLECRIV